MIVLVINMRNIKNIVAVYNLSIKMLEVQDNMGRSRPINTDEFALSFDFKPKLPKNIEAKQTDSRFR